LLAVSCKPKESDNDKASENVRADTLIVFSRSDTLHPIPILDGDLEHTLNMYSSKDTFEIFIGDDFVKIFSINKVKFGIVGDSLLRIYNLNNGKLEKTSSEERDIRLQQFETVDINNDGYEDAVIYDNGGGINYMSKVLIFNPITHTLVRKKYLDLENLEVDNKTHLLKTYTFPQSLFGGHVKAFYRLTKVSIELVKEVLYYNQSGNNATGSVLKTTTMKNGKLISDSIVTTENRAFNIFRNSLWGNFEERKFQNRNNFY
jgi:hypothetical protein